MSCGFSFVFEYRISVLVSFNVFFFGGGGNSPVNCDFGVFLIWCELTSFCSTISSQGPALFQNHTQFFHFSYIICLCLIIVYRINNLLLEMTLDFAD